MRDTEKMGIESIGKIMNMYFKLEKDMRRYGVTDMAITGLLSLWLHDINVDDRIEDADVIIFDEISLSGLRDVLEKKKRYHLFKKYHVSQCLDEATYTMKMAQEPLGEIFSAMIDGIRFHVAAVGAIGIYDKRYNQIQWYIHKWWKVKWGKRTINARKPKATLEDYELKIKARRRRIEYLRQNVPNSEELQREHELYIEEIQRRMEMIKDRIENES